MVEAKTTPSRWWWFESHNNSPRRSQWLQSTLAELDEKTSSMLQIIEEDADSFAQRAEMYYKKRPELVSMVEDFYRAHRSLAERYDQVKSDIGTKQWASPLSFKYQTEKLMISTDKSYDSYSETYDDSEESGESEVDDPEQEVEPQVDKEIEKDEVSSGLGNDEEVKLREEIKRLKEEKEIQKEQLMQKDEEKREVIRQLSSTVDMLKEENVKLRKYIAKNSPKKWSPPEFNKLKAVFLGKLFNGSPKSSC